MSKKKLINSRLLDSVLTAIYNAIYDLKDNDKVINFVVNALWNHANKTSTNKSKIALFRIMQFLNAVKKVEGSRAPSVAHQVLYSYQLGFTIPRYARELDNIRKALGIPLASSKPALDPQAQIEYKAKSTGA